MKRYATTRTRFTVFGGDGAFIPEPTDPEALTEAELTAGTKLAEQTYGRDRRTDNNWVTLAQVDPAQGGRGHRSKVAPRHVEIPASRGVVPLTSLGTSGQTRQCNSGSVGCAVHC